MLSVFYKRVHEDGFRRPKHVVLSFWRKILSTNSVEIEGFSSFICIQKVTEIEAKRSP